MPTPEHLAAMAEARASRVQAEADLAAARERTAEAKAIADRLRELRPHIPQIIANLFSKEH